MCKKLKNTEEESEDDGGSSKRSNRREKGGGGREGGRDLGEEGKASCRRQREERKKKTLRNKEAVCPTQLRWAVWKAEIRLEVLGELRYPQRFSSIGLLRRTPKVSSEGFLLRLSQKVASEGFLTRSPEVFRYFQEVSSEPTHLLLFNWDSRSSFKISELNLLTQRSRVTLSPPPSLVTNWYFCTHTWKIDGRNCDYYFCCSEILCKNLCVCIFPSSICSLREGLGFGARVRLTLWNEKTFVWIQILLKYILPDTSSRRVPFVAVHGASEKS